MSKRIVREIDFTSDGAHIALVTKAANGEKVLLMKQENVEVKKEMGEILISTSMQTFLTTFFYMWEEDAAELSKILGYEPRDWTYDIIGKDTEITLLKSLSNGDGISKELYDKIEVMGVEFTKKLKKEEKEMPKTKVEDVDLQKSIDDAVAVALAKQIAETTELKKALTDKETVIADLQKAADDKIKGEYVELCKGYSFVEDADVLAETLFLAKGVKGFDLVLETLEKARDAIAVSIQGEVGTDQEAELKKGKKEVPTQLTKTAELVSKRYSNKETK